MKRLGNFVDKMADKARLRRARHKGGTVPARLHKVNVEYYHSGDEDQEMADSNDKAPEKRTVEMYDLMHKTGSTLKAYNRQDDERAKALMKLKKLGIGSVKELDERMLQQLQMPAFEDDIRRTGTARSSSTENSQSDQSSLSSDNDDLMEEFKRETEREKLIEREREETRQLKAAERKKQLKEKAKIEKKKADKKKRKHHKVSEEEKGKLPS